MSVEELIEQLHALPRDAPVFVRVRANIGFDGQAEALYEFRDEAIEDVLYGLGEVIISLDENVSKPKTIAGRK